MLKKMLNIHMEIASRHFPRSYQRESSLPQSVTVNLVNNHYLVLLPLASMFRALQDLWLFSRWLALVSLHPSIYQKVSQLVNVVPFSISIRINFAQFIFKVCWIFLIEYAVKRLSDKSLLLHSLDTNVLWFCLFNCVKYVKNPFSLGSVLVLLIINRWRRIWNYSTDLCC